MNERAARHLIERYVAAYRSGDTSELAATITSPATACQAAGEGRVARSARFSVNAYLHRRERSPTRAWRRYSAQALAPQVSVMHASQPIPPPAQASAQVEPGLPGSH